MIPVTVDPHLIWIWAGFAIALAVQTVIFHWSYRNMDNDQFMTYEDDNEILEEHRRSSVVETGEKSEPNEVRVGNSEEAVKANKIST